MDYTRKAQLKRAATVVGILLAILVIGIPISVGFYLSTESHIVLREAKNAKLALEMTAIERGGKNVYSPESAGGMADGVWERVSTIVEDGSVLVLEGYDVKHQRVTAMTYSRDHFKAVYTVDENGKVKWEIDYLVKIQEYSDQN